MSDVLSRPEGATEDPEPLPNRPFQTAELTLFLGQSLTSAALDAAMKKLEQPPLRTHDYIESRVKHLRKRHTFAWIWPQSFGAEPDELVHMDFYLEGERVAHVTNQRQFLENGCGTDEHDRQRYDRQGVRVLGSFAALQLFVGTRFGAQF